MSPDDPLDALLERGPGAGRRRRMLFLVESFTGDGPDHGAVVDFLAATEVFAGLDRADLRALLPHLESVHVTAGSVVVAPGAVHDALFLVGHGRLAVDAAGAAPGRELGPGQVVGADALLGPGRAGTGVRALRDSLLLRLDAVAFQAYARRHPDALLGLCRALVRAAAEPVPATAPRAEPVAAGDATAGTSVAVPAGGGTGAAGAVRTVAVVPVGAAARPDLVREAGADLAAALAALGPVVRLSAAAVDDRLGPGAAGVATDDPRNGRLVGWLQRVESDHRFVVYEADGTDPAWTARCLRQADRVLLVAVAGDRPAAPPAGTPTAPPAGVRRDLVLLHAPTAAPRGTGRWLDALDVTQHHVTQHHVTQHHVTLHHHVRRGDRADYRRLARHLAGTARGLVLGGGGMRGFAHLGVMQALDEAGVEIDVVGGTSIGSIMGGFYAAGLPHAERLRAARTAMVEKGSLVGFTLPMVSLSSGRKVSRLLREEPAFGADIEDLPTPFFCMSASLSTVSEVRHDRGPLWRAIRASISLPGIFPPVHGGDALLVDGGVLNNLPVDVMASIVGPGPIVASDLDQVEDHAPDDPFDVALSGWRLLAARVGGRDRPQVPGLLDVLVRSLSLSSTRNQRLRLARRPVALHLRPPVGTSGLLDFAAGPALVEPAYRHTLEALERSPLAVG